MRAPDPARDAVISKHALLPVEFSSKAGTANLWRGVLPVENGRLRFLLLSGGADWQPEMFMPSGQRAAAKALASSVKATSLGLGENTYAAEQYSFEGLQAGEWALALRPQGKAQRGYLLIEGDAGTELASYPQHRRQLVGASIVLTAMLTSTDARGKVLLGHAAGRIEEASLRVIAPDGTVGTWPMFDDGRHGDGAANDGLYAGAFPARSAGSHVAQVMVRGRNAKGATVLRTAEHVLPVIASDLRLAATRAAAVAADGTRLSISIPVQTSNPAQQRYRVFAEVWGRDARGADVPVAWVGGMATRAGQALPLGFDERWVAKAGARAPFTLRKLRIEDADHFIPLVAEATLALPLPASRNKLAARDIVIDEAMAMGPRPPASSAKGVGSRLLLVHGYCSNSVWPASQFSNASVFLDAQQNRSHDQFAQRIASFGTPWNSYGTVAHSQGGAASLHLYAYYWSGLDNAVGNRLMQSVGTPYQGTNLSGILATVGSWFGVACGSNSNMTYSGASAWLAGIPTWARAKANFHTTAFRSTNWWTNDYCNFASDLVLSDPEDGTTEQAYGQLPGAVNRGHVAGQCHTAGMRDPAQYLDAARNATMNSNAAR